MSSNPVHALRPAGHVGCRTLIVFTLVVNFAGAMNAGEVQDRIAPKIELQAAPFEPGDVKLLPGPYRHAMELDAKFLLSLDADRLLSWYRKEAGLPAKAQNYEGWESQGIAGHSLGHYLSACARMSRAADDPQFCERVAHVVAELAECQAANGDGFLGAMPNGKQVFSEVSRGEIRSAGFDLNGSWVPWYNLHKLFAGLIDSHRYCGNEQALQVACGLADWTNNVTAKLTPEQWQQMLACEHGGMNESLAELYALTGNEAYLDLAKKFYHTQVLDPLAAERDELAGKHANTQVPKAIGVERLYQLTGDKRFARIAPFFWRTVTENHTYANGGNSDSEHFGPPRRLSDRLGHATSETCNTYNMLKLSSALFCRDPQAAYADYMERSLWNHILASQHPETGQVCYYVSLRSGDFKKFMGLLDFTCCNGSGMENHSRYGDVIYFHSGDRELWVNQFIASEVDWKDAGVRVTQETEFPRNDAVRLKIAADQPNRFALHLRQPPWVDGKLAVMLNGEPVETNASAAGYATIEREWQDGDVIEFRLPMGLRSEPMPDRANRVAAFYGPILLAGDMGTTDSRPETPIIVSASETAGDWIAAENAGSEAASQPLSFRTKQVGQPADVLLKPFYDTYDHRHLVYWDRLTPPEWEVRRAEIAAEHARLQELEARTIDQFAIGEMQAERDHQLTGEKSTPHEFNGRKLRHAVDGGWFAFDMAVSPDAATDLVATYWGSESGPREFDVLVDGERVATQSLHQDRPERFWDQSYQLPPKLTAGKKTVNVRFAAKPGNYAGGVFGLRTVRRMTDAGSPQEPTN